MKILLFALALASVAGLRQRSLGGAPDVAAASTDDILLEIKYRVEVCGSSKSPLAALSLDDLFAELKKREAAKDCEGKPAGAPAGGAGAKGGAGAAGAAGAGGAEGEAGAEAGEAGAKAGAAGEGPGGPSTTTSSTTPCPRSFPDNFMDEVVDHPNPEFSLWDLNKDGCLSDRELTAPLRRQIEMARSRDYYWVRRNITNAARGLAKGWSQDHDRADENGNACLNKEEMRDIHEAICDCPTQFLFMDHNADGKISRQEASTYVKDQMPQADINYVTLSKIFKAADVDDNKYLSEKEFCEAGPRYHGDGKPWLPVPAPAPGPAPR